MNVSQEEPEILFDSVETLPDAIPLQAGAASHCAGPLVVSRPPPRKKSFDDTAKTNSRPAELVFRRGTADPETIRTVEDVVHKIVHSLQRQDENISIALTRKRPTTSPSTLSARQSTPSQYKLSFPGDTPEEAWRFTVVLRMLELIHEALINNIVISKRNIYYKDPELFKSQKVVDRYVDILSYTFGLQRAALHVTAAAKGLVAGSFTETYHDSSTGSYNGAREAIIIDNVDNIRSIEIPNVQWILVIEKESTFRSLDSSKIHEISRAGKGIILTAKGYPDVSTRAFLRLLSISAHHFPPIYAIVDFDPDGISIMSTYKYGSLTLAHEHANLRTPTVRWLGVKSTDLNLGGSAGGGFDEEEDRKGLLRLSKRDRKKAVKMLGQEICEEDGDEREWRIELQFMLMLNMKVEMEILSEREGGVQGWVEERLLEGIGAGGPKRESG